MKEIIVKLGAGTIETGFTTINVDLKYDGIPKWEDRSILPANPELQQLLKQWQLLYPAVIQLSSGDNLSPVFETDTITNVSSQNIVELNKRFKVLINDWLNHGDFGRVVGRLRSDLNVEAPISFVIVSEQSNIWELPWHYWNFFEDYSCAVEVFCKYRNTNVSVINPQHNGKVNILGLIGQDPKLNLNLDFLKKLPQANPEVESATSACQISEALNRRCWDILVFNGHGNTIDYTFTKEGVIYLDENTSIEISDLKTEVKRTVDRGLQIAIFNCCSGLGIAAQLSDVNIPYIIVMREKIPNLIAQRFLKELLDNYSQGNSFPQAFRYAREQLKSSEGGFAKVADWLPILFHNPLSSHVSWWDLSATVFRARTPRKIRAACSNISHPKHRTWKTVGIGFIISAIALKLLTNLPGIVSVEKNIIDNIQATNEARISPERSQVTIVNYNDELILALGVINDDSKLVEMVDKVEQITKPLIWGIDLEVDPQPKIFDRSNVVKGCNDYAESIPNSKSIKCDRQLSIATIWERANIRPSSPNNLNWNSNSLTENSLRRILTKIDRVDFSEISKKSPTEIKQLFDGKIVLVGLTDYQEVTSIVKKAIELDRIIRANRPQNPLPLPIEWPNWWQKLLWVFGGSFLGGLALWNRKRKLLVLLLIVVSGQIVIAVLSIGFGYGVPIVVTSIAILMVGGVIYTIQHLSLDRPA